MKKSEFGNSNNPKAKKQNKLVLLALIFIMILALGAILAACADKVYTVTFESNGGSAVQAVESKSGEYIQLPSEITKDGYIFLGWYEDKSFSGRPITEQFTPSKSVTLYARWEAHSYKVEFIADGIRVKTLGYSADCNIIEEPAVPMKDGFKGEWEPYRLDGGDVKVNAWYTTLGATDNLTYSFENNEYTVTGYIGEVGNVVIPSTYRNYPVTAIGDNAFKDCDTLKTIEIKQGIRSIGLNALSGCPLLKTLIIPSSVKQISLAALQGCNSLESIALPHVGEALDLIENSHFGYIFGALYYDQQEEYVPMTLKNVAITDASIIDKNAFYSCSFIRNITLPDSLTTIDNYAFDSCKRLASIVIPVQATNLGVGILANCTSLESAKLPNAITHIPFKTFYNCQSLKNFNMPVNLTHVYSEAFYNCKSIESLVMPDNLRWIDSESFAFCTSLKKIVFSEKLELINRQAFMFCESLVDIVVPDSVETIENGAFRECNSLVSITLPFVGRSKTADYDKHFTSIFGSQHYQYSYMPDSLRSVILTGGEILEPHAFYGCKSLTDIVLPNSLKSIGEEAFYICSRLSKIDIPLSVTSIGAHAFVRCDSLTELVIPDNVKEIGLDAFSACENLVSLTLPFLSVWIKELVDINTAVANKLRNVVITGGDTIIDRGFYECRTLTSITLPEGLVTIGKEAFMGCNGLVNFEIPKSVTSIGTEAFYDCSGLTNISIPENVVEISSGIFSYCSGLTEIDIPNSIVKIDSLAFFYCSGLTKITIPNSVIEIGGRAFDNCSSLTDIVIPSSVEVMGDMVFRSCHSLTDIWCETAFKPSRWYDWDSEDTVDEKISANIHWGDTWEYVDGVPTLKPIVEPTKFTMWQGMN